MPATFHFIQSQVRSNHSFDGALRREEVKDHPIVYVLTLSPVFLITSLKPFGFNFTHCGLLIIFMQIVYRLKFGRNFWNRKGTEFWILS